MLPLLFVKNNLLSLLILKVTLLLLKKSNDLLFFRNVNKIYVLLKKDIVR